MTQYVESAKFLAGRIATITAGGHMMIVEPGTEYDVPSIMFDAALKNGMTPMQDLEFTKEVNESGVDSRSQEDKFELLVAACEELIAEGSAKKFTQLLKPKISSVREIVNFDFNKQTMLRAYDEAVHRTEQEISNGNDSSEHSGSVSGSDTE